MTPKWIFSFAEYDAGSQRKIFAIILCKETTKMHAR